MRQPVSVIWLTNHLSRATFDPVFVLAVVNPRFIVGTSFVVRSQGHFEVIVGSALGEQHFHDGVDFLLSFGKDGKGYYPSVLCHSDILGFQF